MSRAVAPRRRSLLEPTVFTVVGIAVLISLGAWQLQRKAWKEALNETMTARLAAAPVGLPPRGRWQRLNAGELEFLRVSFPAELLNDQEALVYTAGSALRSDVSGPGYWVFTPARLLGGSIVIVNRGFVPAERKDVGTRAQGAVSGIVDIVGVLRWPEERGLFTSADEPQHNVWYLRNPMLIAAAKNWGPIAPFYIDQEQPQPPGGLPRVGRLHATLSNNHLQYALTWFGLAIVLAGVYLALLRARWREH